MKCEYCGIMLKELTPEWVPDYNDDPPTETFHSIYECPKCELREYIPRATRLINDDVILEIEAA